MRIFHSLQPSSAQVESRASLLPFKIKMIQMLLLFGSLILTFIWYYEAKSGLMGEFDALAYPILVPAMATACVLIWVKPSLFRGVISVTYGLLAIYLVGNFYYIFVFLELVGRSSPYHIASLSQWLPLVYFSAFIFFNLKAALIISIGVFLALAIPKLIIFNPLFLGNPYSTEASALAINLLLSHPLYIGLVSGVAYIKYLASEANIKLADAQNKVLTDPLTGVANRRAIDQQLARLEQEKRMHNRFLMVLDLDNFKAINDQQGHTFGDQVLVRFSQTTQTELRQEDFLGRWGGEEFIVIAECADAQAAQALAQRINTRVASLALPPLEALTVSIGVAQFNDKESVLETIKRGDKALYQAKKSGRNQVVLASMTEMEQIV